MVRGEGQRSEIIRASSEERTQKKDEGFKISASLMVGYGQCQDKRLRAQKHNLSQGKGDSQGVVKVGSFHGLSHGGNGCIPHQLSDLRFNRLGPSLKAKFTGMFKVWHQGGRDRAIRLHKNRVNIQIVDGRVVG